ncbi:hypothetical protein K7472_17730 [Streptomyces sp. PTM05]|uniref:Uncharacterized protein n=1 Tax=Streptantibioticus parmotrematis TaxID=2873249 RepID=A0ABS7QU29_9ACTN|nr:hypothetical protein [Streptantibioticus parmotrematis]MBY8886692.1 hypothetical protein [Streptantibioticus parmotrematis]
MEQRNGPKIPPVHAAGLDPAFVPGLTLPRQAEAAREPSAPDDPTPPAADETVAAEKAAPADEAVAADQAPAAPDADEAGTRDGTAETTDATEADEPDEADTSGEADAMGGPSFEASDHRGGVTADRRGVRFTLDGEEADFTWDEIGAVEVDTPRFGRTLIVTVYTTSRHTYEAYVDAPNRSQPKRWATELDAILDEYFEA